MAQSCPFSHTCGEGYKWSVSCFWLHADDGHLEATQTQLRHNQVAWGQNGHPRLSWLFQTSFSSKINSNYFSAMGLEQHCLQELPAKPRNAHIWFNQGSSYNHKITALQWACEPHYTHRSLWVVPGWTRGYPPLFGAQLVGLGSSSLHFACP